FDCERVKGQTTASFKGDIVLNRASTARIDCFAEWEDYGDRKPQKRQAQVFSVAQLKPVLTNPHLSGASPIARREVVEHNELLLLKCPRIGMGRKTNEDVSIDGVSFDFKDERARLVTSRLESKSRFGSDFAPKESPLKRSQKRTSRWVPASRPPKPPVV